MKAYDIKQKALAQNPKVALEAKRDLAYQVARLVEEARMAKNMTQDQLATLIGTQQSNIARAERGIQLPSLSFLKRIAEIGFKSYLIPPKFGFMSELEVNGYANSSSDSVFEMVPALAYQSGWAIRTNTATA